MIHQTHFNPERPGPLDSEGAPVHASGGGFLKADDGVWHWFGESRTGFRAFAGISHYTSPDLLQWTRHADALAPCPDASPEHPLHPDRIVERPKVLRSAATGLRKTLQALATYARKLSRPETWKKILRGHVQTGMVTKALTRHETRSAAEAAAEDQTLKRFRSFRGPLLFVFGGSDPDAPGSSQAYARYCAAHRIPHEIHTIPHAGHSYYGEAWTRDLFALSERFLSPTPRPRP